MKVLLFEVYGEWSPEQSIVLLSTLVICGNGFLWKFVFLPPNLCLNNAGSNQNHLLCKKMKVVRVQLLDVPRYFSWVTRNLTIRPDQVDLKVWISKLCLKSLRQI